MAGKRASFLVGIAVTVCLGTPLAVTSWLGAGPASASVGAGVLLTAGLNSDGQLGVGEISGPQTCQSSFACSTTAQEAGLPEGVRPGAISAGYDDAYTIGSDANLYAWGNNSAGQLGIGESDGPQACSGSDYCSPTPVVVDLPAAALPPSEVSTNGATTMALGANGVLYGWGNDGLGQLGTGENPAPGSCTGASACSTTPIAITLATGVTATQIAMAGRSAFAIGTDGQLYAWGFGEWGELANGMYSDNTLQPPEPITDFPAGVTITSIFASNYSVFGNGSDGKVYSWGFNEYGQLGQGTSGNSESPYYAIDVPTPALLPSGVQVASLETTGFYTTYAVGTDGNLYVWGNNQSDFGNGSTQTISSIPETVPLPGGATPFAVAAQLSSGSTIPSVYVATTAGTLYEWGQNNYGEFADGQTPPEYLASPTLVPGFSDVTEVSAGNSLLEVRAVYTQPYALSSSPVRAHEDVAATIPTASIDPQPGTATAFSATINWGDGTTPSTGTVVPDGEVYTVEGTHTYTATGRYTVTTTVTDSPDISESVSTTATVTKPAKPTLKTVSPKAVGQGATTSLTLSGSNFIDNLSQVTFSSPGVSAGTITFVSPSKLMVAVTVSGSATTGAGNVSVSTPGGTATCTGCLTVDPAPAVTTVTGHPAAGATTSVTVKGSGFKSGLVVSTDIPGASAGPPSSLTLHGFKVALTVPSGTAPGMYTLTVTNPDGGTGTYSSLRVVK
jgi:alpha-tubulin suppressor-like RCC1 family protein